MKKGLFCLLLIVFVVNCKEDEVILTPEEQLAYDVGVIDEYLKNNNITAQVHSSGLRFVIDTLGEGPKPDSKNCIRTDYVGVVLGETEPFDQGTAYKAPLVNFIVGWQFGFRQLNPGSVATFYIPSGLAYGPTPSSNIPANSILVFDVKLLEISVYNAPGNYCN